MPGQGATPTWFRQPQAMPDGIPELTPGTPNAGSRSDDQTGSAVHCPQRAEQDQEKRSRCLFVVLMISVSSVIAGVEVTGSSSFGVRATAGCGRFPPSCWHAGVALMLDSLP